MQLRDHPLMSYRGYRVWPPIWVSHYASSRRAPHGEVGQLREVRCYPEKARRIFLTIEHEGEEYTGCLLMEYQFSCELIASLLERCKGMAIETIASLDLPVAFGTFRKATGYATWHCRSNCSHWPHHGFEQRVLPAEAEAVCNECNTLRRNGQCRTN